MSRKDYIAIAAIVARHIYDLNDAGIALVSELADWLEEDNERFDRDRFADACIGLPRQVNSRKAKPKTLAGVPFSPLDPEWKSQ